MDRAAATVNQQPAYSACAVRIDREATDARR
jgi:hypothetical protein